MLRSNGTLVITGYALASPSAPLGVVLLNMDVSGTVLWHRYLEVDSGNFAYQTIEDDDNGLIVDAFSGSGTYDGLVFKLSSNALSVVCSRQFSSFDGDASIATLRVAPNSFITGGYIGGLSTAGSRGICIIRHNPLTGIQWAFTYCMDREEFLTDLIRTNDGNIIAVSIGQDSLTNLYHILLLKIDLAGNLIWSSRANGFNSYNLTWELYNIKELPDERLVLVGHRATSGSTTAAIVKITCAGVNNCSVIPSTLTRNALPIGFNSPIIGIIITSITETTRTAITLLSSSPMVQGPCNCPIVASFNTNNPG